MKERRKHSRRPADDYYLVYDRRSNRLMGRVLNMSAEGVLLITEEPLPIRETVPCRLIFPDDIDGIRQANFDAECRWCRFNERTGLHEMGLQLSFGTNEDQEIVAEITKRWTKETPTKSRYKKAFNLSDS